MTVATESYPFDTSQATEARWPVLATRCLGRDSGVLYRGNYLATVGDSTGMQVKVSSGEAWIDGGYGRFDTNPMTLAITSSVGIGAGNRRIDRVVVRTHWGDNQVEVVVKTGTVGTIAAAVPAALTQTTGVVWEQSLAQVYVGNGDATVTAAMVIDERTFARNPASKIGALRFAPVATLYPGELNCDGAAYSRVTYAEVYAYLGGVASVYGQGDGSTTFNVPDYRGEVLAALDNMGSGAAGRLTSMASLSAHYGDDTHTSTPAELPHHVHGGTVAAVATTATPKWLIDAGTGTVQGRTVDSPITPGDSGGISGHDGVADAFGIIQPTHMVYVMIAARPA